MEKSKYNISKNSCICNNKSALKAYSETHQELKCDKCLDIFYVFDCYKCKAPIKTNSKLYKVTRNIICKDCNVSFQRALCGHCRKPNYAKLSEGRIFEDDMNNCSHCFRTFRLYKKIIRLERIKIIYENIIRANLKH